MQFEFAGDGDLKVVYGAANQLRCILSEIDATAYGEKFYYTCLHADRDPTDNIRAAGWQTYTYEKKTVHSSQPDRVQLTDAFGAALYLCNLPNSKQNIRRELFIDICANLEVEHGEDYVDYLDECNWDLKFLHAMTGGATCFPDIPVVKLPENKTLQFPWQLFNHPLHRKSFNDAKKVFLEQQSADDKTISLVAYPDPENNRTWQCPKEGCNVTRTVPARMAYHLAEHPEYEDLTVQLATAYFSTKTGNVTMRHNPKKIGKPAAVKRQRNSEGQVKTAKSPKTNASLTTSLEAALQLAAARDKQNDRLIATVEKLTENYAKQAAAQAQQVEIQTKILEQNQQLLTKVSENNSLQGSTPSHGTFAQAAETLRVMAALMPRLDDKNRGGTS